MMARQMIIHMTAMTGTMRAEALATRLNPPVMTRTAMTQRMKAMTRLLYSKS